jgi:hypothetical protein
MNVSVEAVDTEPVMLSDVYVTQHKRTITWAIGRNAMSMI